MDFASKTIHRFCGGTRNEDRFIRLAGDFANVQLAELLLALFDKGFSGFSWLPDRNYTTNHLTDIAASDHVIYSFATMGLGIRAEGSL